MDLNTVTVYRAARSRSDLDLARGERFLGGGTWLYSEPQPEATGPTNAEGSVAPEGPTMGPKVGTGSAGPEEVNRRGD